MESGCEGEQSVKAACCACLTELVVNDANGHQTVLNNGIYQLASLLVEPINRTHRPGGQTDPSTTDQPDAGTVQLQVTYLASFSITFIIESEGHWSRSKVNMQRVWARTVFQIC